MFTCLQATFILYCLFGCLLEPYDQFNDMLSKCKTRHLCEIWSLLFLLHCTMRLISRKKLQVTY